LLQRDLVAFGHRFDEMLFYVSPVFVGIEQTPEQSWLPRQQ
jgi:hypothetical protein